MGLDAHIIHLKEEASGGVQLYCMRPISSFWKLAHKAPLDWNYRGPHIKDIQEAQKTSSEIYQERRRCSQRFGGPTGSIVRTTKSSAGTELSLGVVRGSEILGRQPLAQTSRRPYRRMLLVGSLWRLLATVHLR